LIDRNIRNGVIIRPDRIHINSNFEEVEEGGYIGYVAALPGANTQGETLQETRENLTEAIQLILSSNRERTERTVSRMASDPKANWKTEPEKHQTKSS
jgi:predicted RNase H-like HicB family nuclease